MKAIICTGMAAFALSMVPTMTQAGDNPDGAYLGAMVNYSFVDSGRDGDQDTVGGHGLLGYPLGDRNRHGLEFFAYSSNIMRDSDAASNGQDRQIGAGVQWAYRMPLIGGARWMTLLGVGVASEDILQDEKVGPLGSVGVAATVPLGFLGWNARVEVMEVAVYNEATDPDKSVNLDTRFNIGIQIPTWYGPRPDRTRLEKQSCALAVVDVRQIREDCRADSDGDQVDDALDLCPGTPRGAQVDGAGCRPAPVAATTTTPEASRTVVLRGVRFPNDSAALTATSEQILDSVASTLLDEGGSYLIEIAGHTSSVGAVEYNIALSEKRAQAVKRYLTTRGVPDERMMARGYGPLEPIADNNAAAGRDANRRVEIRQRN